jgi:biotin carboxyl carrier protein
MKFKVTLNQQEAEIEVKRQGEQLQVTLPDGRTADLRLVHQNGPNLVLAYQAENGRRQLIRTAGPVDGDKRQVWADGRTFTYTRQRQQATPETAHSGSLSSTIPAVVAQILVNVGDEVAVGDKLILLESMKMVIPIQSLVAGVVTAVNCQPGQSIQAGVPLLELSETATNQQH